MKFDIFSQIASEGAAGGGFSGKNACRPLQAYSGRITKLYETSETEGKEGPRLLGGIRLSLTVVATTVRADSPVLPSCTPLKPESSPGAPDDSVFLHSS
jgi:hypothetical protein